MAIKYANQHRHSRNSYAGRQAQPFSNGQKAAICILAKEAFARLGGERIVGLSLEEWRRAEQFACTGLHSLTECTSDHYKRLQGNFLNVKGEAGRAMNSHIEHQTEPVRVALFKLEQACQARGLSLQYAGAIARRRWKCGLEDLDAKRVWQLVFTINQRGGKVTAKNAKNAKAEMEDQVSQPF